MLVELRIRDYAVVEDLTLELSDGLIGPGESLQLTSRMNDDGVVFGDGVESDALQFLWGRRLTIRLADTRLHLLQG